MTKGIPEPSWQSYRDSHHSGLKSQNRARSTGNSLESKDKDGELGWREVCTCTTTEAECTWGCAGKASHAEGRGAGGEEKGTGPGTRGQSFQQMMLEQLDISLRR